VLPCKEKKKKKPETGLPEMTIPIIVPQPLPGPRSYSLL